MCPQYVSKYEHIRNFSRMLGGLTWDSKRYEVHHIDGDHENNAENNLVLLPKKLHRMYHKILFDLADFIPETALGGLKDPGIVENEYKIHHLLHLKVIITEYFWRFDCISYSFKNLKTISRQEACKRAKEAIDYLEQKYREY